MEAGARSESECRVSSLKAMIEYTAIAVGCSVVVVCALLAVRRELVQRLERQRVKAAKQWLNDRDVKAWAAVKAGRCWWCLGSGLELTVTFDPKAPQHWHYDEPDWDVSKCHLCDGAGVPSAEGQARMLELWQQMIDSGKLDDPMGVSLRGEVAR